MWLNDSRHLLGVEGVKCVCRKLWCCTEVQRSVSLQSWEGVINCAVTMVEARPEVPLDWGCHVSRPGDVDRDRHVMFIFVFFFVFFHLSYNFLLSLYNYMYSCIIKKSCFVKVLVRRSRGQPKVIAGGWSVTVLAQSIVFIFAVLGRLSFYVWTLEACLLRIAYFFVV